MTREKTVVVHSSVRPDDEEEEEELRNAAAVAAAPATAQGPPPPPPSCGDDDEDDVSIAYVAQKGAPVSLAAARSAPLKRPRSSPAEPADAVADAAAAEGELPDDTDHPNDRAAYARWQARDAARPKKLLLG
ncbi:uncharacterized protein Tco025E_02144 [Trypanosoma conorhini]|uniref:Uncharacterized protein n=1 Tax=Trypanosoma conorhini TaxID=83891 RepID=A0A422Q6Z6_9TRYP|nr:uncharacterized protein Tco025E_02144 [Trypanosoma conorhini]RNF25707.1 hypothetical protein Tco025E_02144 [Trypanosoma conorhini]